MPRPVVRRNQFSEVRIVWILVPAIVVAKVQASIVGRICQNEVYLAAVLVQTDQRLKVFAFEKDILRLLYFGANAELLFDPLGPRL